MMTDKLDLLIQNLDERYRFGLDYTPHILNEQAMICRRRNIRIDKMISCVEEGVKTSQKRNGPPLLMLCCLVCNVINDKIIDIG
jgi:hypothetical protein